MTSVAARAPVPVCTTITSSAGAVEVVAHDDVEAVATELQTTADRAPRTVGSLTQRAF